MLPNDMSNAEILNQQLEQIGFCRIFADREPVDVLPHLRSGDAPCLMNSPNDLKMAFRVPVDPLYEHSDNVISAQLLTAGGIGQQVADRSENDVALIEAAHPLATELAHEVAELKDDVWPSPSG